MTLPDAPHGRDLGQRYQTRYAFQRMLDFFDRHLAPEEIPPPPPPSFIMAAVVAAGAVQGVGIDGLRGLTRGEVEAQGSVG